MSEDILNLNLWEIKTHEGKEILEELSLKESECSTDDLQKWLAESPQIIDPDTIIIGKDVDGMDLLGLNNEGRLTAIELKIKNSRDGIMQAINYASKMAEKDEIWLFEKYRDKHSKELKEVFANKFRLPLEKINFTHPKIIIVGTEPDEYTARMIRFMNGYGMDINFVTFRYFVAQDGKGFLTRNTIVQAVSMEPPKPTPREVEQKQPPVTTKTTKEIVDILTEFLIKHPLRPFEVPTSRQNYVTYYFRGKVLIFIGLNAENGKCPVRLRFTNLAGLKNGAQEGKLWVEEKLKSFKPELEKEKEMEYKFLLANKDEAKTFLNELDEYLKK